MATGFQVDRDTMQTALGKVQDAHDQVTAQRTQLAGYAADLAGGWRSGASTVFQNAFTAFDGELQKLLTALEGIHTNLTTSHGQYANAEATNTSIVNKVSSAING